MNDSHKYQFAAPGVPWARYDKRGRRIPDDAWADWAVRQYLWIRLMGYLAVLGVLLAIAKAK
ncbi:MAG: hypothetical protein WC935_00340 [Thermoleophilia bacterium]